MSLPHLWALQKGLVVLILAITDQFENPERRTRVREAQRLLKRLKDDYRKAYFAGIILEREARAFLTRGMARNDAYEPFRQAMEFKVMG